MAVAQRHGPAAVVQFELLLGGSPTLASGAIDVKPLITRTFAFDEAIPTFELAAQAPPGQVKLQIVLPQ